MNKVEVEGWDATRCPVCGVTMTNKVEPTGKTFHHLLPKRLRLIAKNKELNEYGFDVCRGCHLKLHNNIINGHEESDMIRMLTGNMPKLCGIFDECQICFHYVQKNSFLACLGVWKGQCYFMRKLKKHRGIFHHDTDHPLNDIKEV
jgi:hypothetical protein